ncbi:MAG: hypothetical protein NZ942_01590 [Candidatus Aenigmarchaeota archaeon]|nr:hypothetical protein [Candidatus Aenigmarchaeota archaeon]
MGLRSLNDFKLLILTTKINGILFKKAEMEKSLEVYRHLFESFIESEENLIEVLGNMGG